MLYLQQQDKNKYTTEQIFQQCEKRYQGDSYNPGIVQQNLYLQRLFTDFNQLTASGDFFQLAELLYRPLYCAVYQADNAQEAE